VSARPIRWAPLLLAAAALWLGGCAGVRRLFSPPPEGVPSARPGWLVYPVGALRLEAPAGWSVSGEARRLVLDAGDARLEVWVVDGRFGDGKGCLAAAEEALERGEGQLARVRRHTTTLGGRPAVMQEADAGGWHGWAYAVCDGGVQHRLFFTGRSPIPAPLLDAWHEVVKGVRLGGAS
jgi:hypothetical protein